MEDNQTTTVKAINIEIKAWVNTCTIPRRANPVKWFERFEVKFVGKKYGTKLNSTEKIKHQ